MGRGTRSARPITVHLVPHTHTDPGWLDTADGYYKKDVRPILDHTIEALTRDGNRTFVWSETCFFARYYEELKPDKRAVVHDLVDSGRLEFSGGGWVQHDEALSTVRAMVDSMAEGHEWLRSTFGVEVRVGWQLDTFGHSAASSALLGRMGFQAVVINRIHYLLKKRWRATQQLEFLWQASSPSLGWGSVLAHVLHTHYATPNGFDYEAKRFEPSHADRMYTMLTERAEAYRTSELMLLIGDDFRWRQAAKQYVGWERLAAAINARENGRVRMLFSTPSRYFHACARPLHMHMHMHMHVHGRGLCTCIRTCKCMGEATVRAFVRS